MKTLQQLFGGSLYNLIALKVKEYFYTKQNRFALIITSVITVYLLLGFWRKSFFIAAFGAMWFLLFYLLLHSYICFNKKMVVVFVFCTVGGNILLFIYTRFQNFIPYWDYSAYWVIAMDYKEFFYDSLPFRAFFHLYSTTRNSDYTILPIVLFVPFFRFFGQDYSFYIMLIYNLYLLPFYFLMINLIGNITKKPVEWWLIVLLFTFTPVINPVLVGYLDGIGLMFIAALFIIFVNRDFRRFNLWQNLFCAFFLVFFLFARRWYLFFIVAFFAATVMTNGFRLLWDRNYAKEYRGFLINISFITAVTITIVAVFFFPYLKRLITNDLSDIYSAYMSGTFWENANRFILYYGRLLFLFACTGALRGFLHKKTRELTLLTCITIVIAFLLFIRVQSINAHHHYIFAACIFLLICFNFIIPYNKVLVKYSVYYFFSAVLITAFVTTYIPAFEIKRNKISLLFSTTRMYPRTDENIDTIRSIADYMKSLMEEGGRFYVISSSVAFNDDMLVKVHLPYDQYLSKNHWGSAHVDKRDGFPNHMLTAKYILVANPVQLHLREQDQQVVSYLAAKIIDGQDTQNLLLIKTFELKPNITVTIYERTGGYSLEFLENVRDHFLSIYPDYEYLTNIDFDSAMN